METMADPTKRLVHSGSGNGVLLWEGLRIPLPDVPQILPGLRLAAIDYAPLWRHQQVRESAQGWRDMSYDESKIVLAWMESVVAQVRKAAA